MKPNELGATSIEYALIVALIAIAALAAMPLIGKNSNGLLSTAIENLEKANTDF